MNKRDQSEKLDQLINHLITTEAEFWSSEQLGNRDDDLSGLVRTAAYIRKTLRASAPDPSFVRNAEVRVLNRVRAGAKRARVAEPAKPRQWSLRPHWARALVAIGMSAVLLLSTLGVGVAAAEGTLPGETLYPLKRGFEEARLLLSFDDTTEVQLLAEFSDERLREIEGLIAAGRAESLEPAAEAYTDSMQRLAQAVAENPGAESAAAFDERTAAHLEVLQRVEGQVPPQAQEAIQRAIDRSAEHAAKKDQQQDQKDQAQQADREQREERRAEQEAEREERRATQQAALIQKRAEQIAKQYDASVDEVMAVYHGACEADWKCVREHFRETTKE